MNWIARIFKSNKPKYGTFKIEHYPLGKIYKVIHKGKYLYTHYTTKKMTLDSVWSNKYESIDMAKKDIEMYKEQRYRNNVVISEIVRIEI